MMPATIREALASTTGVAVARATMAAILAVALVGAGAPHAAADGIAQVAVPFGATDYRYQVVAHNAVPGFEAIDFDDTDWDVGAAPFGTTGGPCSFNTPENVETFWPVNTDLLVRRTFTLPAGAHNLRVVGTIDNNATVFVNGSEIGSVGSGSCQVGAIDAGAPDALLQPGVNLLAIRGHDFGVATYLDVQVIYDAPLYGVCALYDQARPNKSGSVVPLRFQLCDASGANLSDASIVVHATDLRHIDHLVSADVQDAGHANPGDDFRFDPSLGGDGGYIFNKSTRGLSTGIWELAFTVDGVEHDTYTLRFAVR